MKSSIRNEIKAQIIRAGYTMQEVVDQLHDEYGWSDSVSNLSENCSGNRCGIGRPWSWLTCWDMTLSGRNGGIEYGKSTIRDYAILPNIRGLKSAISRPITSAIKEKYASNPDVDTSRSKYNFHLVKPPGKYRAESERQIAAAGCRTRKDSIRMIETLFTASPEFFKGKETGGNSGIFEEALHFWNSISPKRQLYPPWCIWTRKRPICTFALFL